MAHAAGVDVGGQTMKATRLDEKALVKSFRPNDKCAAGTGAFLEKTACLSTPSRRVIRSSAGCRITATSSAGDTLRHRATSPKGGTA